jgi:ABC-type sugar transport system substrate-binding protein
VELEAVFGDVTPVLEALRARGVPVVVYSAGSLPPGVGERHPDLTVLRKQVQPGRLLGELQRAKRQSTRA